MRKLADSVSDIDNELVHRVRNRDMQAFRTLVDCYKDKSLSLAISIVKDEYLAEDIVQDVFIKVYKKIGTFKFKSKFSTWLYRIVINTSYNELKKQRYTVPVQENEKQLNQLATLEGNDKLTLEDQKAYIQRGMQQLKTDEALVLRLFYLCEMSLKEIEDITKFKASKIRVDLFRGRKNLKKQLRQLLGDEIEQLL